MTREEIGAMLESSIDAYRQDPSCEHAANLRVAIGHYMKLREGLSGIGPTLAVFDVLDEQHSHDAKWIFKIFSWILRRQLKPERPGWNDYFMMRWRLTGDAACLREIHRRMCHLTEWPEVVSTAHWMVSSYRSQNPQFDFQMRTIERACECGGPKA